MQGVGGRFHLLLRGQRDRRCFCSAGGSTAGFTLSRCFGGSLALGRRFGRGFCGLLIGRLFRRHALGRFLHNDAVGRFLHRGARVGVSRGGVYLGLFGGLLGIAHGAIALALLGYIGGKMLIDGIRGEETEEAAALSAGALFMQGVATSIDALSVGFTIAEYGWLMALAASGIIAVVTFFLCMAGLRIGKKFGTKLSGKASVLGGIILIGIGLEIFISGVFF